MLLSIHHPITHNSQSLISDTDPSTLQSQNVLSTYLNGGECPKDSYPLISQPFGHKQCGIGLASFICVYNLKR